MQFTLVQSMQSNAIFKNYFSNNTKPEDNPTIEFFTPDSPPGTEVVKANVFKDGACEEEESDGVPSGFYSYGTGYTSANFSYQDEVHTGTYGAYTSARGTEQNWGQGYSDRYFLIIPEYAYLDQDITMDFWFNAKANPDIAQQASIYVYLRLTTNLGNYYLYYDLSRQTISSSNGTQVAYYDLRAPLDTWTHVVRNVTDDLVQGVTLIPDLSTAYIRSFFMMCSSPDNPTGDVILLLDDASFTNGTGFNYFSDNGDFEDGDSIPWNAYATGPGTVYLTEDDKTQGNSAMNMTIDSPFSNSNAYVNAEKDIFSGWTTMPKSYIAHKPGDLVFSFDWKYSDMANGLGQQRAYFYIAAMNETYSINLRYYLGDENDVIPYSNSSGATYSNYRFAADGLGTRDVWNKLTIDYYNVLTALNFTNQAAFYIGFFIEAAYADDLRVQLLVDDFQMIAYPAGDPGFEDDIGYTSSDPIRSWTTQNNDDYVNITTDVHSGNFAANVSSYNSMGNRYSYRNTFFPVTNNLFTDFWWRLDKITPGGLGSAYTYIRLELDDTNLIYYMLGSNGVVFVNQSNQCYYTIDDHNQTGTWNNLFRNLTADVAYFGAGTHNITEIYLASYSAGSAEVVTIFDDIHFVRDIEAPQISNIGITPGIPIYDVGTMVNVDVVDNILIETVELHYKVGADPWSFIPMTYIMPTYFGLIPAANYGTAVEYYVVALDIYGHTSQLGSVGSPYTYVVDDLIDPVLTVEVPLETETLAGSIPINITEAYDLGSGIDTFEIKIDNEVVYNETVFPLIWVFHTNDYANANHTLVFTLTDVAGNFVVFGFEYTIYNPPTNWEAFSAFMQKWGPYIGGGAGGLAIIVVVLVVVLRRKKGV